MGNIGWSGIIIIAILVVLLFGRGKISSIMGDVAKGIKSFKKGISEDNPDQKETISSEQKPSEDNNKSSEDSNKSENR